MTTMKITMRKKKLRMEKWKLIIATLRMVGMMVANMRIKIGEMNMVLKIVMKRIRTEMAG